MKLPFKIKKRMMYLKTNEMYVKYNIDFTQE